MTVIQQYLLSKMPPKINLSKVRTVAVPLCFGDPRDPTDGCHARMNKAVEGLDPETTLVIQTGGPLCMPMKDQLTSPWAARFLPICLEVGPRQEVSNALKIIHHLNDRYLRDGINVEHERFKVIFSSHASQLGKIEWFAKLYVMEDFAIEYRKALHPLSSKTKLSEIVSTPVTQLQDSLITGFEKLRAQADLEFHRQCA